jgi:glycosyltransferase involved in cell wall biosynthesis
VTSIHHPITVDRRLDMAGRPLIQRLNRERWYGFVRMQGRVARRAGPLITVSESSRQDICRDFRVRPENVHIVPLGVDTRRFRPGPTPRVPGRIVAVTSADMPLKGLSVLLRALAKLATERDVHLRVVGSPSDETSRLVAQLSLGDRVTFTPGLPDDQYAQLLASAEMAVVPSLYEGFSLPAVEHMASGTPLVATRAGALPEVTGDGAVLVQPGDAEELGSALRRLHDSPSLRAELTQRALQRVSERFAWTAVAAATAQLYRQAIGGHGYLAPHGGTPLRTTRSPHADSRLQ